LIIEFSILIRMMFFSSLSNSDLIGIFVIFMTQFKILT
jgi:hypothetical protein